MLIPLLGHSNAETAFVQTDYTSGGYKVKRRVWLESRPGIKYGNRFCYQTTPHNSDNWFSVTKSGYHLVSVMTLNDENNHIELQHLSPYDSIEKMESFVEKWKEALQDDFSKSQLNLLRKLRASY